MVWSGVAVAELLLSVVPLPNAAFTVLKKVKRALVWSVDECFITSLLITKSLTFSSIIMIQTLSLAHLFLSQLYPS